MMDNTAQAQDDQRAAELQTQRAAYIQAKIDAHTYEAGKKPAKALIEEWTEKANTVIN